MKKHRLKTDKLSLNKETLRKIDGGWFNFNFGRNAVAATDPPKCVIIDSEVGHSCVDWCFRARR